MAQHAPSDLLGRAGEVRAEAMRHLSALAGDASMCAIGRSGQSFPAAKYHEGRQAAAAQLMRALRRPGGDAWGLVHREWREMRIGMAPRGPDWVAYAQGGLDALEQIADELSQTAAPQ
jgi:hypothetical protein